jgi:transposase
VLAHRPLTRHHQGMDALAVDPSAPLPDDVATLQSLVRQLLAELARLRTEVNQLRAENVQLKTENAQLRSKLDAALKHRFGRRSERQQPPQKTKDKPPPKRHPHGRSPLPEHLERREVVHDLTEQEKLCPCCGQRRMCIGEQSTDQLDLEPARLFVLRTTKRTYACRHCDPNAVPAEQRLTTAGPTQVGPIAKGLCGPGLLAHTITAKFADHVPVHRLAGQLARSGVTLASSTLGDWLSAAAELLDPLYQLMHRRVLNSRVLHGDDTGVKLRVSGRDRTTKAHLWVVIGDADWPYVVFDFTADYTATGPQQFLADYKGYFQADALAQYEGLYGPDQVKHVCCWAHARRKFVTAAEGKDERASVALALIGKLYAVERDLPALLPPSDDPVKQEQRRAVEELRRGKRQRDSASVLVELKKWLEQMSPDALPKTPLGKAIGYATNNWAALSRYVEAGYLAIDNNLSERTLRAVALGRNNWGVLGSESGGETAAVLYSVVGTCKHLGIDPWAYLRDALPGLFALGEKPTAEQLLDWLPDRWLLRRSRDAPAPITRTG